jgi:hypothetical protein
MLPPIFIIMELSMDNLLSCLPTKSQHLSLYPQQYSNHKYKLLFWGPMLKAEEEILDIGQSFYT